MAIEFYCPGCGRLMRTADETAGRKGRCPNCSLKVQIPWSSVAVEPQSAPPAANRWRLPTAALFRQRIVFSCPTCRHQVRVNRSAAGKKGLCPHCRAVVDIPGDPSHSDRPGRDLSQGEVSLGEVSRPDVTQGDKLSKELLERVGDDAQYAKLRQRMVQTQLVPRGIVDQRVLDAMGKIPRHLFVSPALRDEAYDDGPLPIGAGQTISQPFTVAFMLQSLELQGHERVLEIGTGTGYAAAVLSQLARDVHSVERIPRLAAAATERLCQLQLNQVSVHVADGSLGWPEAAPYDAIVVAAGAPRLPPPYVKQLSEGGRILIPLGNSDGDQNMIRFRRRLGTLVEDDLGRFAFVPLVGQFGVEVPPERPSD